MDQGPRRGRIQDTSADDLFWMGRNYLFTRHPYSGSNGAARARELIVAAATRGHEEAQWLSAHWQVWSRPLTTTTPVREVPYCGAWVIMAFLSRDAAREYLEIVKRAIDSQTTGLALHVYGQLFRCTSDMDNWWYWTSKAAEHGEPLAAATMAKDFWDRGDVTLAQEYGFRALKHFVAPSWLLDMFFAGNVASNPVIAALLTRMALINGRVTANHMRLWTALSTDTAYACGREFHQYEVLCPELVNIEQHGQRENIAHMLCVYLCASGACRRAALLVVAAFRPILGRDMAVMIAKMVYATRGEACQWWHR